MTRTALPVLLVAAALLVACAANEEQPAGTMIAKGTVTGLSDTHGNVYTSIRPDQYDTLGLKPGNHVHVAFADAALTLVIGLDYTDVPAGQPLAVLHREGLTFAIRNGNFSATHGIAVGTTFTLSTAPKP